MQKTRHLTKTVLVTAALIGGTMVAQAAAPLTKVKETTVWSFKGPSGSPQGLVIQNGVRYGLTVSGGTSNFGTVFQLVPPKSSGAPWTKKVLYNFKGGADGASPNAITFDVAGVMYGATAGGGSQSSGTIFQLTPPSKSGAWTHHVIYAFAGGADGVAPRALALYNGAVFGTTYQGGATSLGTVFQLSQAAGVWTKTILHTFAGGTDGEGPFNNSIVFDAGGNLYSTTPGGGNSNYGVVFEMTPPAAAGGAWTETILHTFTGDAGDGGEPTALVFGPDGALYGSTMIGGSTSTYCVGGPYGCGTVYRLAPPASSGPWTETVLYVFTGDTEGGDPSSNLVFDTNGALYGTTATGGSCSIHVFGCGTMYQLTPPATAGGDWTETTLYQFTGAADGYSPGNIAFDSAGALDIAIENGPSDGGNGAVEALAPPAVAGGAWTLNILYSFAQGSDGGNPAILLAAGKNGIVYGAASVGGAGTCENSNGDEIGCGVVFQLKPPATAGHPWTETVLYSFAGGSDGSIPVSGVIVDSQGSLYGTTANGGVGYGIVFQLTPPAKAGEPWTETVLHAFTGGSDGANPSQGLAFDANGALYVTTSLGGASGKGTICQLTPPSAPGGAWTNTAIYSFHGGNDGENPFTVAFWNGVLYGTTYGRTSYGESSNNGTVFQLTPPAVSGGAWTETVIHAFTGGNDGTNPYGIVFDSSGAIYGATAGGGAAKCKKYGCGIVYQLTPPAVAGGAWTENLLYNFTGKANGQDPYTVVFNGANLVGTTSAGGTPGDGTLFQLTPPAVAGDAWTHSTLHNFNGPDGYAPQGLALLNGTLFGTCYYDGAYTYGNIFSVTF